MLTKLDLLESESIRIFREVIAESKKPGMLYSLGKDSCVMLHIARKAFWPKKIPFPLLHVDTGWKFKDMYDFKDQVSKADDLQIITHINKAGLEKGINPFDHGSKLHTQIMKTEGLKQALERLKFDAVFGGARRDEENSRAKERIFSVRSEKHHWDPTNQRPELWKLYNTRVANGDSIRVFPLSNWTEIDIWTYIEKEKIDIVPLYFAKERPVVRRDEILIAVDDERLQLQKSEKIEHLSVRFRTLGCYPLSGAIQSNACSIHEILSELLGATTSERDGRLIDKDDTSSMEKKKIEGYF